MALNKDGLEPGQLVEFSEIVRIESERKRNAKRPKSGSGKPAKTSKAGKSSVSEPLRTEAAKEAQSE